MNTVTPTRRTLILGGLTGAATAALGTPGYATADTHRHRSGRPPRHGSATMRRWASDTWRSLVAMTDKETGLPADNIPGSLATAQRSGYTSPTNIGGLLWSAVVARELRIINPGECTRLCRRTLQTLLDMEHDEASGLYYNWYDEGTAQTLRSWPTTGETVYPFVSSVDNAWLGAALMVVREAVPGASKLAGPLFDRMRWDAVYDPDADRPGGLMHGGFYPEDHDRPGGVYRGTHIDGPEVWLTTHHYDTIVSETRMTSYLGILTGQVPPEHYFAAWRTFPASCDWSWHEMQPVGRTRTYLGIEVYEGAYTYRGMHVVPGWGGSMFEELMPDVFVPEATWAPRSWGRNHPLHVRAQYEHGMKEAGYGYWGFSPASDPFANYREYGVDALGLNPDGYFSDVEMTSLDLGFGECREGTNPNPEYGDGVVTPHAAFLAMMHAPQRARTNLQRIETELGAYGPGGFYDAVAVGSGRQAQRYLALDQAMIMGAIGNVAGGDVVRRAFGTRAVQRALRPVIGQERFGAGLVRS
ncbi:MAG: glucoamylase family protein [Ornithinimicrobium sp.]